MMRWYYMLFTLLRICAAAMPILACRHDDAATLLRLRLGRPTIDIHDQYGHTPLLRRH